MSIKINLGNTLFNSNRRIEELTNDNINLSKSLKLAKEEIGNLTESNDELIKKLGKEKNEGVISNLEYEQLQFKHNSLMINFEKLQSKHNNLEEKNIGQEERINYLVKENKTLTNLNLDFESELERINFDVKVIPVKLDFRNS